MQPFRGSVAVGSGALTRNVLFGPRYRRVFPDVYVAADAELDLELRARAAVLATGGVASGWSAAELLDASCGPAHAAAEVTVDGGGHRRAVPGLVLHRDRLCADEVTVAGGTRVTAPHRTAFDIVRWRDLTEGVVAVDALAHRHDFDPSELNALRSRHLGARGTRKLEVVLRLADPRAESPMETRIRIALHNYGLPAPEVQFLVAADRHCFRLDMAYPLVRLGVEYDGRHHRTQEQAMRDLEREALLAAEGWKILRFRAAIVLHRPAAVTAAVRRELDRRGRALGLAGARLTAR
jgi:very-short-patch-repair endonuclease